MLPKRSYGFSDEGSDTALVDSRDALDDIGPGDVYTELERNKASKFVSVSAMPVSDLDLLLHPGGQLGHTSLQNACPPLKCGLTVVATHDCVHSEVPESFAGRPEDMAMSVTSFPP